MPTKGFHFIGDAIVFELKFFKEWVGVSEAETVLVRQDVSKIRRLFKMLEERHLPESFYCFIVVFAKTDRVCTDFIDLRRELESEDRFSLIYKNAGVALPDRRVRYKSQQGA